MITGIVYTQFPNGDSRCFATGTVELYEDEGLTSFISSSPIALGSYTLPDSPNYSDRVVYLVVRNTSNDVIYKNQFIFYSDPYGNQINYPFLDIYVYNPIAVSCSGGGDLFIPLTCSFYIIRKPCTNTICVYNTSSSNYNYVSYTFYYGDTIESKSVTLFGDNSCFNYGDCIVGNYLVCQTLRLYDAIIVTGGSCCGNTTYEGLGEVLDECTTCEEFELGKRLPEVSFVIENQCCNNCPCYEVDTPITFNPIVKFNLTDCCIGTTPQPCLIPPSLTFIKEDIFMYDKPYTMPVDGFIVDDVSAPDYNNVYKISLKFELDVACLCDAESSVIVRSLTNTYFYALPIDASYVVIPSRVYYILDDNTPLYFGSALDTNIYSFETVPSVGNQDIDFDLYFLFNGDKRGTQLLSFKFEIEYCGTIIGVEVVQTIESDGSGNLVYSQLVTIS